MYTQSFSVCIVANMLHCCTSTQRKNLASNDDAKLDSTIQEQCNMKGVSDTHTMLSMSQTSQDSPGVDCIEQSHLENPAAAIAGCFSVLEGPRSTFGFSKKACR